MTSSYITQSEAAVSANREFTRRKLENILDQFWLMADTCSPTDPDKRMSDEYLAGWKAACMEITGLIEQAGGMYPPSRSVQRMRQSDIAEAAE